MRRFRCVFMAGQGVLILAALLSCSRVDDQNRKNPEPARLLPSPPDGWQVADKTLTFSGVALSDYINGGAEAYFAYGFRTVAVKQFRNDANARLAVEVYEMDRPENAYGIFSTDSAGEHWDVGAGASYGSGLLRFWKGPYFIRIMCFPPDSATEEAIRETGVRIANSINSESRLPEILKMAPQEGIDPDTICYFHRQTSLNSIRFLSDENLLHLSDGVEALTWIQVETVGKLRQIVLLYPSKSVASDAFRDFTDKYLQLGEISGHMAARALTAPTPDGKYADVSLKAPWLLIVLDAPTAESAGRSISQTEAKVSIFTTGGKPS